MIAIMYFVRKVPMITQEQINKLNESIQGWTIDKAIGGHGGELPHP